MRLAHVRALDAPPGFPWRLAAAIDGEGHRWLDLEQARERAIATRPTLARTVLHGDPVSTLDGHLARGLRVSALRELIDGFVPRSDDDPAILDVAGLRFGPPILAPRSLRDFFAFERHAATTWNRAGMALPEAWYRLPIFYFSNVSELRGDGDPVWAPEGSVELDYEAEIAALIDVPGTNLSEERGEDVIGGYCLLNDWSARDLQRDETTLRMGAAKGKDFALTIGPWLVTPDELAGLRATGGTAPEVIVTATVHTADGRTVETTRSSWAEAYHSFGAMVARASRDVHLRPGELLASGTVGGGCLLEVREDTLGRWLLPGDTVVLEAAGFGRLTTPLVARQEASGAGGDG